MAKKKPYNARQKRALQKINMDFLKLRLDQDFYILGLDPSMSGFGWCILDLQGEVVDSGTVKPGNSSTTHFQDLSNIYESLYYIIKEYNPQLIAFEQVSVSKNFTGLVAVSKAHGAMYASINGPVRALTSVNLKSVKKAAGHGGADKDYLIKYVHNNYEIRFADDNQCDAYLIARIAKRMYENATNYQGETDKDMLEYNKLKIKNSCDMLEFTVAQTVLAGENMLKETSMKALNAARRELKKLA